MHAHARVVIVGGGMLGVGLAYHLAAEGWTDVTLLEKHELTSGSTWHAAGLCTHFIADDTMARIHAYGIALYPRLEAMTGQSVSWHASGSVRLAVTADQVEWFRHVRDRSVALGFPLELIDPPAIRALAPDVTLDGVLMGAWTPGDGHVDPAGACSALAKAARALGVTIVRHNRVLDIEARAGGEWRVHTERGPVTCEHVVNAGGCHARRIGHLAGVETPIVNMEHQYVVTEPAPAFRDRDREMPVFRDPRASAYYRQEQHCGLIGIYEPRGREAWSARDGEPSWDSENELFDADFERIEAGLAVVMQRLPCLSRLGIRRVVNGAIPHTPDGNPLLGPAGGVRNFWQCNGSAIGIVQGAGCGRYLAQWMVHGDAEIDLSGLDPRRFGAWADRAHARAKAHEEYRDMYATVRPHEQRAAGRGVRTTPLHARLAARGGVHTPVCGWERPDWFDPTGAGERCSFRRSDVFETIGAECRAVRERVGLMDLSSLAKFDVTGPDAGALLERVYANRMPRRDGGIVLAHRLSENGRIQSEATVTRLGARHFYVLSGAAWQVRDLDALRRAIRRDERVSVHDVTERFGNLALAGPRARDTLAPLADGDLGNAAFAWLTARAVTVAGIPVRALRVSYAGELGFELHCPMESIDALYCAVRERGERHGIADFGARALDSLRMEKAYRGIGTELTGEVTLVEAGMTRFLARSKGAFVGREASAARAAAGVATRLVYLDVDPAAGVDARGGEAVTAHGRVVGAITSGAYGHAVGRSLAFAYVEPDFAAPGTALRVRLLDAPRSARVLARAAYDPDNTRLRA